MQKTYGVLNNGIHTDTSNSERGAKIYATKNGFNCVSVRFDSGYFVRIVATKQGKKWINQ